MKTLTRKDIVNAVKAENPDLTKEAINSVVASTLDAISAALSEGDKVSLHGFGTFETRPTKARKARNPRTGEDVTIPASARAAFRPSQSLKDAVKSNA